MNNAQKLNAAVAHVEKRSADLLHAAVNYGEHDRGTLHDVQDQQALYAAARSYADAVRALARRAKARP